MALDAEDTSGDPWGKWLQGLSNKVVDGYVTLQSLETSQRGQAGDYYREGQRGAGSAPGGLALNSGTLLLIGGVIALAFLLRD